MHEPARPQRPKQKRSQETYERLLNVAGQLLAEVGVQDISTNLICSRAGVTPPALYRYMKDKYEVIAALAERLMERQNQVLDAWLARHAGRGIGEIIRHIDELLRATAEVTASEPGALWILRSLRAVPQLTHIRRQSHDYVAEKLAQAYASQLPEVPPERLRLRIRISIEFGYAIDEALLECPPAEREAMLSEAANMLGSLFVIDPPLPQ